MRREESRVAFAGWTTLLAAGFAMAALGATATANPASYPVEIVRVPNAPAEIVACSASETPAARFFPITADVANRTTRDLRAFEIRIQFRDRNDTVIATTTLHPKMDEPLAPGDQASYSTQTYVPAVDRDVARQTCRIQRASFAGRSWSYGQRWPERLRPPVAEKAAASRGGGGGGIGTAANATGRPASPLRIEVANAWNDVSGYAMLVHDTVVVHGAATDVSLRPSDFALTMGLTNGARKTYNALAQAAPSYAKTTLGSTATTAYQVDPKMDLGALGSIVVPANATVTLTVTFFVSDAVADSGANRGVTLR